MNKDHKVTVETILDYLKIQLDCSQKIIAGLTGLNESTLSANASKVIEDVATKNGQKRLVYLYLVVHHFVSKGISPIIIKESINEFVYKDLDGNFDSVISALLNDKYPPSVLINIGELGYQRYTQKLDKAIKE